MLADASSHPLVVPSVVLEKERTEAFAVSLDFIMEVHRKYGFDVAAAFPPCQ